MGLEKYIPSDDLSGKAAKQALKESPWWFKLLNFFNKETPEEIKKIQKTLEDKFYGVVETICFRNLAYGEQFSIISDSRDQFNTEFLEIIEGSIPLQDTKYFLKEWNQEFYDHVSEKGGFATRLGKFYLDLGKVYFKTEKVLKKG